MRESIGWYLRDFFWAHGRENLSFFWLLFSATVKNYLKKLLLVVGGGGGLPIMEGFPGQKCMGWYREKAKKHHVAALANIIKHYQANFGVNWPSSLGSRAFAIKHEIEEK